MKVLLVAVLIDAFHAALEDAEEAFDGIGGRSVFDILAVIVVHALVRRKFLADGLVDFRLTGVEFAARIGSSEQIQMQTLKRYGAFATHLPTLRSGSNSKMRR